MCYKKRVENKNITYCSVDLNASIATIAQTRLTALQLSHPMEKMIF